jgi:two-component system, chemotaxis family, sensor kinase CheA
VDPARYAELFLTESREHLSAINHALLGLERTAGTAYAAGPDGDRAGDEQRAGIAALFRAVHTIKGMSATMGYTAVATLSHELEALLDRLRRGETVVDTPLMDTLFRAADALESSIERAVSGKTADPKIDAIAAKLREAGGGRASAPEGVKRPPASRDAARPRTGRRRKAAPASRAGGRKPRRTASAPVPPGVWIRVRFVPDVALPGVKAAMAVQRARTLGEVTAVEPAEATFAGVDFGRDLAIRVVTTLPAATIARTIESVGDVASVGVEADGVEDPQHAPAIGDLGARVPASGANGTVGESTVPAGRRSRPSGRHVLAGSFAPAAPSDGPQGARHVRIDLRRLDALMNLIGELVIARGRLLALTAASEDPALVETVDQSARLIGDLQDEIMTCRMVPVWQVFDRFPRLVRDAARSLGKQVAFEIDGKEIELDRSMLDEIGDPIVHLLRNAVDHGIEDPEARVAAGKPAEGRLTLSAVRDRSAVLIRVADDGRGIDRDRVLARARDTGLVDAATTSLTDDEMVRLIARPGFTTAERVTNLSGRGVGIDAVQARVRALGGSVDIKSLPGQGTVVTARLPLTLAIMRALLARSAGEMYAFPMAHVDETVSAEGVALAAVRGRQVILLRGEAVPYVRMRDLMAGRAAAGEHDPETGAEQHVVVLESGGRRTAVAVDELTGQQDIVVKQFDGVRGSLPLFSGATILGDGAPALIVDVSSLI